MISVECKLVRTSTAAAPIATVVTPVMSPPAISPSAACGQNKHQHTFSLDSCSRH